MTPNTAKTCFKCGVEKTRRDFYAHPMMADGLLGKCKDCAKRDVTEHRMANLERIREYDRTRSSLPHRKELRERVNAAYEAAHPERVHTGRKTTWLIRSGQIQKPSACERCGCVARRIEAHHPDYSRPDVVEFLCKPCHYHADREREAAEANQ